MKSFFVRWISHTLALLVTGWVLPGVWFQHWTAALLGSLVLGLLNAFVRPVLLFLTLPLNIVTLGIFTIFLNAAIFFSAGYIIPSLMIKNYTWAIAGSLVFSTISTLISWLLHERRQFHIGFHLWRY